MAALSLGAEPVRAQESEEKKKAKASQSATLPAIEIEGKAEGYKADATTTATKTNTPLLNVPQAVSIIPRDAIDDLDMQSLADVVRYTPGVYMGQGEGHRDAPILRGNISTADLFIDGVRDDVQYYRDFYNVDRVEVLKGPNAMIFGRGGGGGVINRVTKRAEGDQLTSLNFETGYHDHYRGEVDTGMAVTNDLAIRLNGMYENSDSYRDYFELERYGINPTLTYRATDQTTIRLNYEYLDDERTVDRGVPSRAGTGRPYETDPSNFFGNPDLSYATTAAHLASATIEHAFRSDLKLRNHTLFGSYDKFYSNVFANSAVNGAGNVTLGAYRAGTKRQNLFNQTDLIWDVKTGSIAHTLLAGVEVGRQWTDNIRDNSPFALVVPANSPVTSAPVAFSTPNQDNHVDVGVIAVYLQDQIQFLPELELVAGVRYDHFDVDFDNHLTSTQFNRKDNLVSPRAGLIYKPWQQTSFYASYSVSYLPSSGDQFASLTATTEAFKPERFENIEVGIKWDITPDLSVTAALYQLDRDNTTAPGSSPGTTVLTGSQRSRGFELSVAGKITEEWEVLAGYAVQEAEITTDTLAAPEGRDVALVPQNSVSLWNKYQFTEMFAAGVGVVHQGEVYTSISNAVALPAYTRVDAAAFIKLNDHVELQINAENLFGAEYYSTAHNDNNITPGSPRALRFGLRTRF